MELKLCLPVRRIVALPLLIVPYGIETSITASLSLFSSNLLIVPYGIET